MARKLGLEMKTLAVSLLAAAAALGSGVALAGFECRHDNRPVGSVTVQIAPQHVGRPGFVALAGRPANDPNAIGFWRGGYWSAGHWPILESYAEFMALPASITIANICVPRLDDEEWGWALAGHCSSTYTTASVVGAEMLWTYGVLTPQDEARIGQRRAALDRVESQMRAQGRWNEQIHGSDEHFARALIARDGVNRAEARVAAGVPDLVVPFLDCTPPDTGGGN